MNAKLIVKSVLIMILLVYSLSACAGEQPTLIGSYPAQEEPKPLAVLPRSNPPTGIQFVYDAWITLEVSSLDSSAERAAELAARHGGYLESSNTWLQDGRTYMNVVLAVPAVGFDDLRVDLLDLGTLQDERVSGSWVEAGWGWSSYSHITLTLQPRSLAWPDWPDTRWNPGHTFRQALDVFLSIFGFIVDILIWVLVVLGPFVLIGLGLRALWRRAH